MNILVISDIETPALWDYFQPSRLENIDMILSCGDLDPEYLTFLVTMAHCPLFYIHGNHDGKYETHPPEGCVCLEDQIYTYQGIRILGLGGSFLYNGGSCQYSEKEMEKRVRRLRRKLKSSQGFDILLTHAPARGLNDSDHPSHRGFEIFNTLIEQYSPKYFIHGHVHLNYGANYPRISQTGQTLVINGYGNYVFDYSNDSLHALV